MPTYDYACQSCDHEFEQFQSMSAALLTKCPECGEKKLKRLVGAGAGLIFKGTGFYITDYKNKSGGGEPKPTDAKSAPDAKAAPDAKSAPPSKSTPESRPTSTTAAPTTSSAPTTTSTTTTAPNKKSSS